MTTADASSTIPDKDVLRQREIDAQLAALLSPAPNTRAAAARRLGDLSAGMEALLDALHDPSDIVRSAAAMSLGSFSGHPREADIIDFLLAAIDDTSEKVCQSSIRSLGMLHAQSARDDIEDFLDDASPYIQGAAILALARLGADDLAERLASFLNDDSTYIQMQSARAVGIMKYHPADTHIVRMLNETRALRDEAGFIDPASRPGRHAEDLYSLQNQLIRTAGELQLAEAVPTLLDIAQKDIGFRGLAVEALVSIGAEIDPQILSGLLSDPSVYLRKRLIQLMYQYNYRPAMPLLRKLLQDENVTVRVAALQAITSMKDNEALPVIEWMCYHDSNPFIRVQALQTLAEMIGREATTHLLALSSDVNFQVRRTAVSMLVEWQDSSDLALADIARFARDFPTDNLSPDIQKRLDEHNYVLKEAAQEPPEAILLPAVLLPDASTFLAGLERWYAALGESTNLQQKEVQAALRFLMNILRNQ